MTEQIKTSMEATFDGKPITLKKLKAGRYYEAQKIYIGMINSLREKATSSKNEKNEEASDLDVDSLYDIFPKEVAKLVSSCTNIEVEKLLEEGYPEEITEIANKVIELNNFNENLKNSVAPLGSLGAKKV